MNTVIKNEIVKLEKEIEALEERMLRASGSGRAYSNLKNEQWAKINELKKLRSRLNDNKPQ